MQLSDVRRKRAEIKPPVNYVTPATHLKIRLTRQSSCMTARGVPPAPPTSKSFQNVCPFFCPKFCPKFLSIFCPKFCPFFVQNCVQHFCPNLFFLGGGYPGPPPQLGGTPRAPPQLGVVPPGAPPPVWGYPQGRPPVWGGTPRGAPPPPVGGGVPPGVPPL